MKKKKVLVLFGGNSSEHEISILSAQSVLANMDQKKYEIIPVYITKKGEWRLIDKQEINKGEHEKLGKSGKECGLIVGSGGVFWAGVGNDLIKQKIDIVFPVLHGGAGEDGSLQGYLDMVGVAYVGCGMTSSMVCMDKELMKLILKENDILMADYLIVKRGIIIDEFLIEKNLSWPVFIKPARAGSSVGISRVESVDRLEAALKLAFAVDDKVLIEQLISGREIEVSVLGNDEPKASLPGEVVVADGWYDYENKYKSKNTKLAIPAKVSIEQTIEIKELALRVYRKMGCQGLARVDLFLLDTGELMVNEINTMPGFTEKSMYPKLWEVSGLTYKELIDELIRLGLETKDDNCKMAK